jgi:hypothetical protein
MVSMPPPSFLADPNHDTTASRLTAFETRKALTYFGMGHLAQDSTFFSEPIPVEFARPRNPARSNPA